MAVSVVALACGGAGTADAAVRAGSLPAPTAAIASLDAAYDDTAGSLEFRGQLASDADPLPPLGFGLERECGAGYEGDAPSLQIQVDGLVGPAESTVPSTPSVTAKLGTKATTVTGVATLADDRRSFTVRVSGKALAHQDWRCATGGYDYNWTPPIPFVGFEALTTPLATNLVQQALDRRYGAAKGKRIVLCPANQIGEYAICRAHVVIDGTVHLERYQVGVELPNSAVRVKHTASRQALVACPRRMWGWPGGSSASRIWMLKAPGGLGRKRSSGSGCDSDDLADAFQDRARGRWPRPLARSVVVTDPTYLPDDGGKGFEQLARYRCSSSPKRRGTTVRYPRVSCVNGAGDRLVFFVEIHKASSNRSGR